jgi:hypothetical protein
MNAHNSAQLWWRSKQTRKEQTCIMIGRRDNCKIYESTESAKCCLPPVQSQIYITYFTGWRWWRTTRTCSMQCWAEEYIVLDSNV